MKDYYNYEKEKILNEFETQKNGISSKEAVKRLEKYGKNEIQEGEKKSVLKIFLEQYTDFLVIILIAAAVISAFLGDIESSAVIFVVITMNAILGTVQQIKADKSLESLKALSSPIAKVIRDGEKISIDSKDVVPGDIVIAEAGDYICADGRILENYNIKVDESSLTGESISVEKEDCEISGEVPVGDRKNMVFSGSFVTYGRAEFVVTGTGMDTELGKVAKLLKDTKTKKTPLQKNLDNFGKKLSIIILIICGILFAVSIVRGDEVIDAFMFAVALAVAAIPEALSSIVTIVLSFGTQKMAKENAIVRKLHAVEGLGSVSIICSDKTGTLTQNKMTVKKYSVNNTVIDEDKSDFSNKDEREILYMSMLCNDAENKDGNEIGDPTEIALINFGEKYGYDYIEARKNYPRIGEIAFDSDRKLMSTVNVVDGNKTMITKGAVDVLMNRVKYIVKNGEIVDITDEDKNEVSKINENFSKNGLRVLAFAKKYVDNENIGLDDENNMIFVGLISMMDPPRVESKDAVSECISAGIRPVMITGDHKVTAAAIAKEIGIIKNESEAVDGAEIDKMTDEELQNYVDKISVYARVSPEHKIRIVRAWQNRGNIVAMTGDGVNDAPALKQADIGVAMGITGSEVAKDAADVVLADDNFATIVKAVENGRNLYINIKNSIKFLLSGNTAGILAVLYASLAGLAVPFAPVHLLFINLLTDSLPAIALGVEPHSKSVMKDKPRPVNESILTKDFIIDVVREGIVICIGTMAAYYVGLNALGAGGAMTMAFSTLCLSRLIHGFNCKSKEPVIFTKKMFNNIYIWGAFFVGFILLNIVLLVPALFGLFEITPLSTNLILTIYGISLLTFVVNQIIKFVICKIK